jgi:hypothetical protein
MNTSEKRQLYKTEQQMSNLIKKVVTGVSTIALAVSMLVVPVTTHAAAAGEVYKTTDGTVWFITSSMQKRPFTSEGAFMSYGFLSFSQVRDADASVTALPTGSFIAPQDGRIFCATMTKGTDVAGECSLVTAGKKAAFTSANVFSGQGYSFSRAYYGDSSFLEKTSNIDNASAQHRPGTLINNNGTVQLVVSGGLWGVPSMDVFNSWGWSFADVVPANSADVLLSQTGVIPARTAGSLVPTATAPSTPGEDTGDCNLSGNAGDITVTQDSTYATEEVGEGEEEVGVIGFEVEADDDSDIAVTSVKVELKQTDNTVSQDITDYIDEVQVMYAGEVVGTADADDFTETSDVYTKSISLDCAEVEAGETGEFSVSVSALNSLDSADIATDNWEAELMQVRFEDGDGVTSTEAISANSIDETFDFVDFATAADVELRVALNDDEDSINEAHNIIVEDDQDTDDVELLAFTLEARGESDVWVDEIPVLITSSDSDLDSVISSADLYNGDDLIGSENVTTAGAAFATVTFDDLDMTIDEGDTEDFTVKVNVIELTGNYAQGATLQAQVTVASIDAEDQEGDNVASADLTGSAVGEASSLFSNGITVEVNAAETTITSTDVALGDVAEFHWELDITNVGEDTVYINADNADVVSSDTAADVDQMYTVVQSGSNALTALSGTVDSSEDTVAADASAYVGGYSGETFYALDSGETITIDIVVSGTNGTAAGQVRAYLSRIEWTTDDITAATAQDATAATINNYTANLDDDSETPYRPIN